MEKLKACLIFKLPDDVKIPRKSEVCWENYWMCSPLFLSGEKKLIYSRSFVILITAGYMRGDYCACCLLLCTDSNSSKLTHSLGRRLFTSLPSMATTQQQKCCFELVLAEMPEQKWTGHHYIWLQLMDTLIL